MTAGTRLLRVGTRGSALAVRQAERVRRLLADRGWRTERVEIRTTGDVVQDVPLSRIGTRALFTKQLDDALLDGRIDLAVHSLKDLPTELPDGIAIGAVGQREDPRDVLVARPGVRWQTLAHGATVATSSLRRRAQLRRLRPDLHVADVRGNIDTRLTKLDRNPEWSGIILAAAGLLRLGLGQRIAERLPFDVMLPAPGQGALAVTVRAADAATTAAVRDAFHDEATTLAVTAERALLRRLEGGCQVPIGAVAELVTAEGMSKLTLRGRVLAIEGDASVDGERSAPVAGISDAEALGVALAEQLLAQGAGAILAQARRASVIEPVSEP